VRTRRAFSTQSVFDRRNRCSRRVRRSATRQADAGRHREARELGERYLREAEAAKLGYRTSYIKLPLATACAALGERVLADQSADSVLECFTALGSSGLNMGLGYEGASPRAPVITKASSCTHQVRQHLSQLGQSSADRQARTAATRRARGGIGDSQRNWCGRDAHGSGDGSPDRDAALGVRRLASTSHAWARAHGGAQRCARRFLVHRRRVGSVAPREAQGVSYSYQSKKRARHPNRNAPLHPWLGYFAAGGCVYWPRQPPFAPVQGSTGLQGGLRCSLVPPGNACRARLVRPRRLVLPTYSMVRSSHRPWGNAVQLPPLPYSTVSRISRPSARQGSSATGEGAGSRAKLAQVLAARPGSKKALILLRLGWSQWLLRRERFAGFAPLLAVEPLGGRT
jgi:hypothetical protein